MKRYFYLIATVVLLLDLLPACGSVPSQQTAPANEPEQKQEEAKEKLAEVAPVEQPLS